jgi:hypothetical protein
VRVLGFADQPLKPTIEGICQHIAPTFLALGPSRDPPSPQGDGFLRRLL